MKRRAPRFIWYLVTNAIGISVFLLAIELYIYWRVVL